MLRSKRSTDCLINAAAREAEVNLSALDAFYMTIDTSEVVSSVLLDDLGSANGV